jgi:transcriptional regulator with XRE-family HTH domain
MTPRQVQEYESGMSRMDAAALFKLSRVLDAPVAVFFGGLPEPRRSTPPTAPQGGSVGFAEAQARFGDGDTDSAREARDLLRVYFNNPDPATRRRVRDLIGSKGFAEAADMGILLPRPATPVSGGPSAGAST